MNQIEIYTKNFCLYCARAKALLDRQGLSYTEYELNFDSSREAEMIERSGRFTVPQIFVDNLSVGGSDELVDLFDKGTFFNLLKPSAGIANTNLEVAEHV